MAYIEFKDVCKYFNNIDGNKEVLNKVSFNINKGELIVIAGPSFSGKSVILNLLSGLDKVSSGSIIIDGANISNLSRGKLTNYRRFNISLLPQNGKLINNLNVGENIELASNLSKNKMDTINLFKKLEITNLPFKNINELNSEEKKKVLIAQCLAKNTDIILLDEPLKELNVKDKKAILNYFKLLAKKEKKVIIISTKDDSISTLANKVILINDKKVIVKKNKKQAKIGDLKW